MIARVPMLLVRQHSDAANAFRPTHAQSDFRDAHSPTLIAQHTCCIEVRPMLAIAVC